MDPLGAEITWENMGINTAEHKINENEIFGQPTILVATCYIFPPLKPCHPKNANCKHKQCHLSPVRHPLYSSYWCNHGHLVN